MEQLSIHLERSRVDNQYSKDRTIIVSMKVGRVLAEPGRSWDERPTSNDDRFLTVSPLPSIVHPRWLSILFPHPPHGELEVRHRHYEYSRL